MTEMGGSLGVMHGSCETHGCQWPQGLARMIVERDRYRAALEEIAEISGPPFPDWQFAGHAEDREAAMQQVAQAALNGKESGQENA